MEKTVSLVNAMPTAGWIVLGIAIVLIICMTIIICKMLDS